MFAMAGIMGSSSSAGAGNITVTMQAWGAGGGGSVDNVKLQLIVQQVLQELVDQEHIQHQHQADQAKLIIHLVQVQQAVQEQTVVMGL
jgi:hypothetical protein